MSYTRRPQRRRGHYITSSAACEAEKERESACNILRSAVAVVSRERGSSSSTPTRRSTRSVTVSGSSLPTAAAGHHSIARAPTNSPDRSVRTGMCAAGRLRSPATPPLYWDRNVLEAF